MAERQDSDLLVFRRTLVVMAGVGTAVVLWLLTDLVLLLFACALVALMFSQFAQMIERRLHLPFAVALVVAVVLPLLGVVMVAWAFGSLMADQFVNLFERLPAAFDTAKHWLQSNMLGREVMARYESFLPDGSRVVATVQIILAGIGTTVTQLGVILVAGIYMAAQPQLYGRAALHLFPPAMRRRTVEVTEAIVHALNSWLKGQGIGMLFVGVGTAIGLWIVGVPSPLAIGLVAGLAEFVPYLGIFVVTIPALILGFSIDFDTGLWTGVALLVVQQTQGNIVSPMAQKAMVDLPPALTIFSLVAAGILMGPLGVILAVPLTVVGLVLVKELWVKRFGTGLVNASGGPLGNPAEDAGLGV
jgi:predicted PurR-regulated permease PerM